MVDDVTRLAQAIGPPAPNVADGRTSNRSYTATYDSKDYPQTGNPNGETIAITAVDVNTADPVTKKGGKVVQTAHSVLSNGGTVDDYLDRHECQGAETHQRARA